MLNNNVSSNIGERAMQIYYNIYPNYIYVYICTMSLCSPVNERQYTSVLDTMSVEHTQRDKE